MGPQEPLQGTHDSKRCRSPKLRGAARPRRLRCPKRAQQRHRQPRHSPERPRQLPARLQPAQRVLSFGLWFVRARTTTEQNRACEGTKRGLESRSPLRRQRRGQRRPEGPQREAGRPRRRRASGARASSPHGSERRGFPQRRLDVQQLGRAQLGWPRSKRRPSSVA
eukprot:Amastigsp_a176039_17.p2 type:complete len:166 gc:universal Amastigsp_a176039_17:1009-1506(+)